MALFLPTLSALHVNHLQMKISPMIRINFLMQWGSRWTYITTTRMVWLVLKIMTSARHTETCFDLSAAPEAFKNRIGLLQHKTLKGPSKCVGDWDYQWCTEMVQPFTQGTDQVTMHSTVCLRQVCRICFGLCQSSTSMIRSLRVSLTGMWHLGHSGQTSIWQTKYA